MGCVCSTCLMMYVFCFLCWYIYLIYRLRGLVRVHGCCILCTGVRIVCVFDEYGTYIYICILYYMFFLAWYFHAPS